MAFDPSTLRRDDYGFFGPDSPSWKVWTSPTSLIGFQRAVSLEHFDPFLTAAVADSRGIYDNPATRLDHTLAYFVLVAVGDGRTAIQAAEHLMKVHAPMTGIEPISGKRYSANSPDTQLWIHITGWHSVLKCYEVYGPGPLSPEEEDRFWAECAIAAELQTCKPADVPRNRAEVRAYFERVRPRLCASERAIEGMHYLMWTPPSKGWHFAIGSRLLSLASIPTLPMWMRRLGRFAVPRVVDPLVRIPAKVIAWTAARRDNWVIIKAAPFIAPMTGAIFAAHADAAPPQKLETITPQRARELYGSQGTRSLWEQPAIAESA
ncbi:oxygenase MpaB family protein [Nocardia neocaledoniensis]|uniref:oxygenase MpaB family protein n=1 Tax=Nocardia neocaledoniensis TaxID=236511 RepID=UPI002454D768|nr:oxygenase MpaB family protein [Nocardia neocaledoniensis]